MVGMSQMARIRDHVAGASLRKRELFERVDLLPQCKSETVDNRVTSYLLLRYNPVQLAFLTFDSCQTTLLRLVRDSKLRNAWQLESEAFISRPVTLMFGGAKQGNRVSKEPIAITSSVIGQICRGAGQPNQFVAATFTPVLRRPGLPRPFPTVHSCPEHRRRRRQCSSASASIARVSCRDNGSSPLIRLSPPRRRVQAGPARVCCCACRRARHGPGQRRPAAEHDGIGRQAQAQDLPDLPLEPRHTNREAQDAELHPRPQQDRAHGPRRPDPHQERARPDPDLPPELQRGYLRQLRHEHQRHQHPRVLVYVLARKREGKGRQEARMLTLSGRPHSRRGQRRDEDLPAPAHLRRQGSGSRPHPVLQAVQIDQAVSAEGHASARRK